MKTISHAQRTVLTVIFLVLLTACGSAGTPLPVLTATNSPSPTNTVEIVFPTDTPAPTPTPADGTLTTTDSGQPTLRVGDAWVELPENTDVSIPPVRTDLGWLIFTTDGGQALVGPDNQVILPDSSGLFLLPDGQVLRWDGQTFAAFNGVLEANEAGLPTIVIDGSGNRVTLEHPGVWTPTETEVRVWNVQTGQFEILEHIKPTELVYQGNWVTGVVEAKLSQEGEYPAVINPVVVYDLAAGEAARGDLLNAAENKIIYNRGVKLGGVWHTWDTGANAWQVVTDELITTALDLGLDPSRTYEAQKWAQGTYLVDTYNGARRAVKTNSGWTKLNTAQEIYPHLIVDLAQAVGRSMDWSNDSEFTLQDILGVYSDNHRLCGLTNLKTYTYQWNWWK